jgi:hypothetical protein
MPKGKNKTNKFVKVVVIVEKPLIQVTETNQICNHKCDCQKRKREKKLLQVIKSHHM